MNALLKYSLSRFEWWVIVYLNLLILLNNLTQ